MNSDLPKVLHPLAGRPLIDHVISTARELNPDRLILVVGHGREEVQKRVGGPGLEFVIQEPQLGTGHAVQQTASLLADWRGDVVVLSGDAPLLKAETLRRLLASHQRNGAAATVLTATAPDPVAYGRIIRDRRGDFLRIVEERDATPDERMVREVNSGMYGFRSDALFTALREIAPDNKKGEYYLTDVIAVLRGRGLIVQAVDLAGFYEIRGINTQAELQDAETRLRKAPAAGNA
ncbi:NTP transferase domain-containing protein [bacterium]|nr:NTP transferase domain-containing protein [bacterium]MBU1983326.1 NTP transferase domain-containing protein [bacterium]